MELDLFQSPAPPLPPAAAAPTAPRVHSVSEVTRAVRMAVEDGLGVVWVEGEISNHRRQASGHQYFTLKDATAQLSCVFFARPGMWRKDVPLFDGLHVQVRGAMTVYEARGQYQLNVQLVQAAGAGLLQARFEALKRQLAAEGFFESARKRPLPAFPRAIGIVTSASGAALRDMLNVLARRAPWLCIVISGVRVQGESAGAEVAAAIAELNTFDACGIDPVDVIVLARGGGSAEDLWAFNEEIVARAIAASAIPIVSAIGHEIDFTIADFVADLRAPTPSAAAELVAPDSAEILQRLAQWRSQMMRLLAGEIERSRARLNLAKGGALFRAPRMALEAAAQRLDEAAADLPGRLAQRLAEARQTLAAHHATLRAHRPDQSLALSRQRVGMTERHLRELAPRRLAQERQRLERAAALLRALAPHTALQRGFTITTRADGTVISSAEEAAPGTKILTRFHDGVVRSTVSRPKAKAAGDSSQEQAG